VHGEDTFQIARHFCHVCHRNVTQDIPLEVGDTSLLPRLHTCKPCGR
jgi:hypothetical protein